MRRRAAFLFWALGACAVLALPSAEFGSGTVVTRDGIKLSTKVRKPVHLLSKKWPCVLDRSPYGHMASELIADLYISFGFCAIGQDFRGTKKSTGTFDLWRNSRNDTEDTIAWIRAQKWSNGEVYQVGASADGIAIFMDMDMVQSDATAVRSQFLIWATDLSYDMAFPGGAYRKQLVDTWLHDTIHPKTAASQLLATVQQHEAPGEWWSPVNTTRHDIFPHINFPSVFWAGWYDIFSNGQLHAFRGYSKRSQTPRQHHIVVDALGHCEVATGSFPFKPRVLTPLKLTWQLWDHMKKTGNASNINWSSDSPLIAGIKRVTFYVMGPCFKPAAAKGCKGRDQSTVRGNYWTTLDDWPHPASTKYYLMPDGSLTTHLNSATGTRTFLYDPMRPVPTVGGNNLFGACGPKDQSRVESRPDVLTYSSDVLDDDVAITGAIDAYLWVSSNASDTDFTVKLTDVYPTGESVLITDGIIRMRWRHNDLNHVTSDRAAPAMQPQEVYAVHVSLWNSSYIFNSGHQIRVSISSSNAPRFSVNPNTGVPIDQNSTAVLAQNSVHFSVTHPGHISLPIVSKAQIPMSPIAEQVSSDATLDGPAGDALRTVLPKFRSGAYQWSNYK